MNPDPFPLYKQSIENVISALQQGLAAQDPGVVGQAVDFILKLSDEGAAEGKLVCCGVGKSGLIARKLAATFASTGTPALFLQPGDALHGDLGVLGERDRLLLVAKSGESQELVRMLRAVLERKKIPVLSLLGEPDSSVGRMSNVILNTGLPDNLEYLELVPTASTSLALACGDALATTVARLREFRQADFLALHPAGMLGKGHNQPVADFLAPDRDIPVARLDAGVPALITIITGPNLGAAMIVDESGKLVGIVTDGDLRRGLLKYGNILECEIERIMNANPVAIEGETLVGEALRLMENRPSQIGVLPVIDRERKPLGLIRLHDIVRAEL